MKAPRPARCAARGAPDGTVDGAVVSSSGRRRVRIGRPVRRLLALALIPVVAGCATIGANPRDPLESINRPIFAFNDAVDRYALKPLAQGYQKAMPEPLQLMISSFFSNLGDLYTGANNLLQAKPKHALIDVTRFVVNSTLGLAGVADVASAIGLPKHQEDFGQTLGWWGVPSGPYLVLPFFGPSSFRDAPTRFVDSRGDPVRQYNDVPLRNTGLGLRLVDVRAQLLEAERMIDGAALDRYSLIRDGWLQRRRNAVYDGDPPEDDAPLDDDSGYSDEPEPPAAGAGTKPAERR